MRATTSNRSARNLWGPTGRTIVFVLAASSIACLLAEFYRLCPMRMFTLFVFVPALAGLAAMSLTDLICGDRRLWRGVIIGVASGLIAAVAYDLFRLPFVFARAWGIDGIIPPLDLYKVFPAFGAMILGEAKVQQHYSLAAHLIGWAYHFSNGITFGVMFVAVLGEVTESSRPWAVVMAAGLELGMLLTPYPTVFALPVTTLFICSTLAAHMVFGVAMGLSAHRLASAWKSERTAVR